MLIAFCFLSGRMGLVETIWMIIIYCAGWHANYQLIYWLKNSKFAGEIENSDSVGGNSVYLFAAVVGLIVSLFIGMKPGKNSTNTGSRQSALIALMGTGFVFAAAPFSGLQSVTLSGSYEFPLNVYFALTASVATTYAFSALFGDYKVGIRESLVGVLGGVAMIASVASYINNIGGCLALGAIAGFVSGFWLRVFHPKINADNRYDQLGLIGPVLINSVIGCLAVAPILFGIYKSEGIIPSELTTQVTTERSSIYYLAIFGISLGVAVVTGLLIGIISYFFRDPEDDFNFNKLVSDDFGLYSEDKNRKRRNEQNPKESAANLHSSGAPAGL